MKFFNIEALKAELSEGSLKQSEVFGYWFASTLLLQLSLFPMSLVPSEWNYIFWTASAVVALVMLRWCYSANGGVSGEKFSDRFVSISWVMLIRGFLFVFIPLFIVGTIVASVIGISLGYGDEGLIEIVENFVLGEAFLFELWVWFRTAAHLRDLRDVQRVRG